MRQLVIITDYIPSIEKGKIGGIILPDGKTIPFSNAKTLLGQEFAYAIYDMSAEGGVCLNLDALAIVAGTLQAGGILYLLCPCWYNIAHQPDFDSLRWNANQPIPCPHFYRYFKQLVREFDIPILTHFPEFTKKRDNATKSPLLLTSEQQHILHNLPLSTADIHLITAARGRGKSTISGKLAERIAQDHSVIITARSSAALPNFWKGVLSSSVQFIAPDELQQRVENCQILADQWLFIDEAASLPLPTLHGFCHYFAKVVLTTTTHNYEGTGRGFSLKLLAQLPRTIQQWQLTKPLRWAENDRLENFINQLLLLEERVHHRAKLAKVISPLRMHLTTNIEKHAFYHLLAHAHYKTTPTDLRRLFDAPHQQFYQFEHNQQLIAGCWAIDEGGLESDLTDAIWRGERRPAGNLVAQYLCFQGNLKNACKLRSRRLSRIAVQPEFQRQGIGKGLVQSIFLHIEPMIDFISVSFGMSQELLQFWTECGFELVQITPLREASSGYRSAMVVRATSEAGKEFVVQAKAQFARDLPLHTFFTELPENVQKKAMILPLATEFRLEDRQNLHGFIYAQRSFSACFTSLKRLYLHNPKGSPLLQQLFEVFYGKLPPNKKMWLATLREQLTGIDYPTVCV